MQRFKKPRGSPEISFHTCRRLQYLQRPTPSHLRPNAPHASDCGDDHVADRRRSGLTFLTRRTLAIAGRQCDKAVAGIAIGLITLLAPPARRRTASRRAEAASNVRKAKSLGLTKAAGSAVARARTGSNPAAAAAQAPKLKSA